jgi:hypothetical protein
MNAMKHLTRTEITAYADDLLPHQELFEIGRHLIDCADCRRLLPAPTVDQFRSAVMTEWEPNEPREAEENGTSFSSIFSLIWNLPKYWIFASVLLGALFTFSYFVWRNVENNPSEIVRNFDHDTDLGLNFPAPVLTPAAENHYPISNSNKSMNIRTPQKVKPESSKPKSTNTTVLDSNFPKNPNREGLTISETRGKSLKCSEQSSIEMEFSAEQETYVFKWKKLPNAVKYHIYISDDDEILIEEFETEKDMTFILNKKLDPAKTYKWKIIVTLENGRTIVGDSQTFTVKDFQTIQKKPEKKRNSDTRCISNG